MNNTQAIQILYQNLRKYRGTMREICEKSGRSRNWVLQVFRGEYQDPELIKVATAVLTERYNKERDSIESLHKVAKTCDRDVLLSGSQGIAV